MSWWPCDGRECKLGWGYNESLAQLILVKGEPRSTTSEAVNQWEYFVYPLSSTILPCWVSLSFIHYFCMNISDQNKSLSGTELQKSPRFSNSF